MNANTAFDTLVGSAKHIFLTQPTTDFFDEYELTSPEMAAIIAVAGRSREQRQKAAEAALRKNAPLDHPDLAVHLEGKDFRELADEALTKAVAVALLNDPEIAPEWGRREKARR